MKTIFKHRNGMTLIELLMVIAIIAVMTAVTVPAIFHMARSSRLRAGAKLITDANNLARSYAISRRYQHFIEYDTAENRLRMFYMPIVPENEGGDGRERYAVSDYDRRETVGEWEELPETIKFYGSVGIYQLPDEWVCFIPSGRCYGDADPTESPKAFAIVDTTTLDDGIEKAKTVVIQTEGITGRVKAVFQ